MDQRKRQVLKAVVEDYVDTAEPVGSRTLARKYGLGVSPATIRNEMADLEEMGFLEQPHTSAGRIPSDRGYRFFVDVLMDAVSPPPELVERLRRLYAQRVDQVGRLLRQTAQVLSEATDCLALVESPRVEPVTFRHLQVLPLSERRALLLLVTEEGLVQQRLVELPEPASEGELARISSVLTRRLAGRTLDQVRATVLHELYNELSAYGALLDVALEALRPPGTDSDRPVYVLGTRRLFRQPEFQDLRRAQAVLGLVEQQELVRELLGRKSGEELVITIGQENPYPDLHDCSLVTASYRVGGEIAGRIAVLGPKRMHYARISSVIELMARLLSEAFDRSVR
ncbi:MAG TPA: heat-inducible transcriptional repressor HrcA [Limnochordales bacterium]